MEPALSYGRVSTPEQKLGFSLQAQDQTFKRYALLKSFDIVKAISIAESAQKQGRRYFGEMVDYLRQNRHVRVVLVEKTDRLIRNLHDFVLIEDLVQELDVEIHLIKEGQILQKAAKSQDRLVQGMFAVLARNYILNLTEEIMKGQIVKAEKGQYPGRARYGYMHDRETRTIVAHPTRSPVVKIIFQLFSTGRYTVKQLRKAIFDETGERISKSHLHRILKSRFYLGLFSWLGKEYSGIHPQLVDLITFERVQTIVSNPNKAKPRKHDFLFSGLMNCLEDGCAITPEFHKAKYIYYHCSFGKGRHKFPYMTEAVVADMLGTALKGISVSPELAQAIVDSTYRDRTGEEAKRREDIGRLNQRLSMLETRMKRAYADKLDRPVESIFDEDLWQKIMQDWKAEQRQAQAALERATESLPEELGFSVQRILELAKRIPAIYSSQDFAGRAQILKMVLLNCATDGKNVIPTFNHPFGLIFPTSGDRGQPRLLAR